MATLASSRTRSTGPVRSLSPSRRFCSSSMSSSSSGFASSSTSFSSRSTGFFSRPSSPTRVNMHGRSPPSSSSSVRFFMERPTSPGRSISSVSSKNQVVKNQKKTCMCSPTTHPGSFRCSLHKNAGISNNGGGQNHHHQSQNTGSFPSNRLNARRSAMTNSLVRIGGVEGELMKRALAALIRPSSHHQRRRADFQPRPSRLAIMSKAEDL